MRSLHQRCGPSIIDAYRLANWRKEVWPMMVHPGEYGSEFYVPVRPLGGMVRLKAAWLVFTGRADALIWRGQS